MKVLYAVQATGNGHISRANEIIPELEKMVEVDVLVSGTESEVGLNHFIKYRRKGLSFSFGKKGGIDFVKTFKSIKAKKFAEEVRSIPVEQYDLVINDFEPLSAWACKMRSIPCISLSHQSAVINPKAPKPKVPDPLAWMVLKHFAPCIKSIGFHFQSYDADIFTPVIRSEIRHAYIRNLGHYTVYLPAYADKKLIALFHSFPSIQWHIFSKKSKKNYAEGNCWIRPVNNYDFISSFTGCEGIITGAGFETPAEALFMGKKLLVVPMKNQYEQYCNAAALSELGVPVLKNLKKNKVKKIEKWLQSNDRIQVNYPNQLADVLGKLLSGFKLQKPAINGHPLNGNSSDRMLQTSQRAGYLVTGV